MNYLALPIGNIAVFVYFILDPGINLRTTSIQSYVIFFNVICVMRVIEFFLVVRTTVIKDIATYVEIRD